MNIDVPVLPHVFKALQNLDFRELAKCSAREIRPVLPCLARISLLPPLDNTKKFADDRKEIHALLLGIETVNSIVALLSIDFHALEVEVKKEQQLRQKPGSSQQESILVPSLQGGLSLEFERSDSTRSLRLVLYELLYLAAQTPERTLRSSELFDHPVYLDKVTDVLCVALAELPAQLTAPDVAENLLHVRHGPWIICRLVANAPDTFRDVCTSLIANGERQEEEGLGSRTRMKALSMLCHMNPGQALAVRAKCVELCRMPALSVLLSLEHPPSTTPSTTAQNDGDIVSFVSGLLLGNDQQVRNWFAMFVRNGQKRRLESHTALQALRSELIRRLRSVLGLSEDEEDDEGSGAGGQQLPGDKVTQASALLRLFCALRGIAAIKFQEEEVALIVRLITSHPPPSAAGVHFVSLGLCMLIACPTLIMLPEHEKRSVEWVKWLVQEEAYFESASGVTASFGEMLLLMAIHFHSSQLSAICDLVCSTLGMKIPIRHHNLSRMKTIFVQEIFTEQVVTAHAVKVPVTPQLSANLPGFLPVHCIHQLLKSRAFSKHRVPIKDWIYRQICASEPPLHPVLPALVEVYVSSILVPASKLPPAADGSIPMSHTNEPITEQEIQAVFRTSAFQQAAATKPINSRHSSTPMEVDGEMFPPSLSSQLLLLYYVLHYEDLRLSASTGSSSSQLQRPAKAYASDFLAELPIKYLLQQAQKHQHNYSGLFSPLLRLLATHFPHLSLVDDWFESEQQPDASSPASQQLLSTAPLTVEEINQAFAQVSECPVRTSQVLQRLAALPATEAWPHAQTIASHFKSILAGTVPRHVQELYQAVWLRLNTVLPRCLWVMTINALLLPDPSKSHLALHSQQPLIPLTQEDIVMDPLQVLRCDERVFRCAPALAVVLRVLQASLAASRSHLARQLQDRAVCSAPPTQQEMKEREDLRVALVAAQEAAAVQILLETCLETPQDKEKPGQEWALRECRGVICSYLHQVFIADPALAKLVHFQGYPMELLPVTVRGIPSMHICLDFLPELMGQPAPDKQVFAVNLVSYLALQYALPKSMSVSRLAVNTLSTLLSVLPSSGRAQFFSATLPALARVCEAFPPLLDDVVSFLQQLGRVGVSQGSLGGHSCSRGSRQSLTLQTESNCLCLEIQETFRSIMSKAVLKSSIY